MSKKRLILSYWLPVLLWAGLIFTFSSFSTPKASEFYWYDFLVKKSAHLTEYAVLFTLFYRALMSSFNYPKKKAAVLALLLVFFYGVSDEFHQSFTPGREPTLRDVIIDTLGGSLGWLLIWKFLPKAPKRLKNWARNWQII